MDRTREMAGVGRKVFAARFAQAAAWFVEWRRRQEIRKARGLASAALLRDIGLTPDDLEEALAQPLDQEASEAMVKAAEARAGNW